VGELVVKAKTLVVGLVLVEALSVNNYNILAHGGY